MNKESKEFIRLVRLLNFDELKQLYCMIKGAGVIAQNKTA